MDSEPSAPGDLVAVVAENVRNLRARAGFSLSELAAAAGIGKSTLSQLESGNANPSIETLWAIARALGVPFGALVEPPGPEVRVLRAGDGVRVASSSAEMRAQLLVSASRRGSLELYLIESEPGTSREAEPHNDGTVEHLLIERGRMRTGPLEAPVDLGPGDLASFPGDLPHVYEALEPGTRAILLMDYR